jgi:rubrerythrin
MILERRDWVLWMISNVVWRIPGRASIKMAGFSHTEAGSGLDMLAAVEETPRREMRARYFRHALDEMKHAGMFRTRALALADKPRNRAQAMLDDSSFIREQGINEAESLFSQLGELEFLAFVWIAERRGAQQFDVYADLMKDDQDTQAMFSEIADDERFHIAYSRAELDRYEATGHSKEVRKALGKIRRRRWLEAWLRFSVVLGDFMSKLWLGILYFTVIAPSAIMAHLSEKKTKGFISPDEPEVDIMARARFQA